MTLLTFSDKYVVQSSTQVSTTSGSLVDDTEAEQTFTLDSSKTVLVIYEAHMDYGSSGNYYGMQNAINIDGTDYANSWDSANGTGLPVRNCVFWVGTLTAGSHTIKGRFASNKDGSTVTIDRRVLVIMIFNGDEFQYSDDATAAETSSTSLVDDPNASVTFTPSGNCKALILYNCSNSHGTNEYCMGKKNAINVNGTDYAQAEKSPAGGNYADSVFTCYALNLSAASTTVKGRFASNHSWGNGTISRRQLAVLLFADSTLLDIVTSTTQISTTSNSLVDDAEASINRSTTDTREVLVVVMGTKRSGTGSTGHGERYGINVDGTDYTWARGAPQCYEYANSVGTAYALQLTNGSHTVKGRFSNNHSTDTAKIDARCLIALWFSIETAPTTIEITDSITLSESSFNHKNLMLTDSASLLTQILRNKAFLINDTVTLQTEILTQLRKIVSDAVNLTEVALTRKELQIMELFNLTDKILRNKLLTIFDSLILTETCKIDETLLVQDVIKIIEASLICKFLMLKEQVSLSDLVKAISEMVPFAIEIALLNQLPFLIEPLIQIRIESKSFEQIKILEEDVV
ncbi:hypothetical protein J7L49_06880 [Candidatus Bathyarchaeota archaeon]|nr:hypothetical protein [Candidatus Bathyarchaeota archaeon]